MITSPPESFSPNMAFAQTAKPFENVMAESYQKKLKSFSSEELKKKLQNINTNSPWEKNVIRSIGYELHSRGDLERAPKWIDEWENQISVFNNPDKKKTTVSEEDTSWTSTLKQAMDNPTEGLASTFKAFGWDGTSQWFSDLVKQDENYQSAVEGFMNGDGFRTGFDATELPRATLEQSGDLVTNILMRGAGLGAGALIGLAIGGPAGFATGAVIGAFGAPAGFSFVRHLGPVVWERARNDGRQYPNKKDWAWAVGTTAGISALDAIGVSYGVKYANFLRKIFTEGFTEGMQSLTEQVGTTVATEEGLNVDPKQIVGETILGGTTRGAVDATVGTVKNVATLGRSGADSKSAKDFESDPDLMKSQVRVGNMFKAEKDSLKKVKRDAGDNIVFRNVWEKLKIKFNDTVDILKNSGALDASEAKEFKDLIKFSASQQRAIGEDDINKAMSVIENSGLSDESKSSLVEGLRDLDQVSKASVFRRNKGFVEPWLEKGGQIVGTGGAVTVNPISAPIGYTVGGTVAGRLGRFIDKATGLYTPEVLKRYAKKRSYMDRNGIDYGDTFGRLTEIANKVMSGQPVLNQATIDQKVKNARARAERRAKNQEGAGGFDKYVYDNTGLKPREVDQAMRILLANGDIDQSTFDKFYNDPKTLMLNEDGDIKSEEGWQLVDKLKGLMQDNGLADFTDLQIDYPPASPPSRIEGQNTIGPDTATTVPQQSATQGPPTVNTVSGPKPALGSVKDLQAETIGAKVEPVSRKSLSSVINKIRNPLAYEATARGKQERYTNAVNNIMSTEGLRPDVKSYLGSTLSPIVDFPDYKSAKSLADVLVSNLDPTERALIMPHLNQILSEKKGAPKGTLDNQFDNVKPNANCDLSQILGKKGPR